MEDTKLASADLAKSQQETNTYFEETDKIFKEALSLFTSEWSNLIDILVDGEIHRLFQAKGIQINYTACNTRGEDFQFDIMAYNDIKILVVEVKTSLKVEDVDKFRNKLEKIKVWIPRYTNRKIHGVIAYLEVDDQSAAYAESKGLWAINATGESISIINQENFKPKIY